MGRWLAVTAVVVGMAAFGANAASAQGTEGAQRWEVTGFPGGGILFQEGTDRRGEGDFTNYAFGGSLTYNINPYWGIEGEVSAAIGIEQTVGFAGRGRPAISGLTPPDMLGYNANVVVYPFKNDRSFVPYATGGVGGLSVFEKQSVGFDDDENFFTQNVGGGVKYYFGRWGIRGDYRFFAVDSKNGAPAFFGRDNRYGHRLYGGVLVGFGQ